MKKTYKAEFNDFGVNYIIAENFAEAENKLIKSVNGGENIKIKSIIVQLETNEPLV